MFSLRFLAAACATLFAHSALAADAPKASAEKFAEERKPGALRALLVGGGSSHDFEKFYHQIDATILRASNVDPVYTENVEQAIALLPSADVLVLSTNQAEFGNPPFQEALKTFADAGKGIVILHPGAWYNWAPASGYNKTFVGGGSRGHDKLGPFTVKVIAPAHPIMKDVPGTFEIKDELYYSTLDPEAVTQVLAETSVSQGTKKAHPSVWTVTHARARIAVIAPGHDADAHDLPAFKTILTNAVRWAGNQ